MPQSLAQVWLHIIFSTKDRRPFLQDESIRDQMFRMLAHKTKEANCVCATVGGHIDHVHLLAGLSRTLTISNLIEHIKTETSKWAKTIHRDLTTFQWQRGYGVFSVSQSLMDRVEAYFRGQAEHHQQISFQEEYRLLCKKHEIRIDERYAWD